MNDVNVCNALEAAAVGSMLADLWVITVLAFVVISTDWGRWFDFVRRQLRRRRIRAIRRAKLVSA